MQLNIYSDVNIPVLIDSINAVVKQQINDIVIASAKMTFKKYKENIDKANTRSYLKRGYSDALSLLIYQANGYAQAKIEAEGRSVSAVEQGVPRYDMKPFLLVQKSGSPVRRFKNGVLYRIIPLRQNTPTQSVKSEVPEEFGGAAEAITKSTMPRELYQKAKSLSFGQRLSNKTTINNVSIKEYGKRANWTSGQYEGLTKVGRAGHTGYMTFRIVTSTQGNKWWQPAIQASPVFEGVVNYASQVSQENLAKALKNIISPLS